MAGTVLVQDINPGGAHSYPSSPTLAGSSDQRVDVAAIGVAKVKKGTLTIAPSNMGVHLKLK